jgi:aerobic carbon-monoxide dehydrogenase large subunit
MTLAELAQAVASDTDAVATGQATFKPQAGTFPNGAHVCEVEIDPETGTVDFVAYSAVEDIGTVVNPMTAHGQVQGGSCRESARSSARKSSTMTMASF